MEEEEVEVALGTHTEGRRHKGMDHMEEVQGEEKDGDSEGADNGGDEDYMLSAGAT